METCKTNDKNDDRLTMEITQEMKNARRDIIYEFPHAFKWLEPLYASGDTDEYHNRVRHIIELTYSNKIHYVDILAMKMIGKKQPIVQAHKSNLDKITIKSDTNRSFNGLDRIRKQKGGE